MATVSQVEGWHGLCKGLKDGNSLWTPPTPSQPYFPGRRGRCVHSTGEPCSPPRALEEGTSVGGP